MAKRRHITQAVATAIGAELNERQWSLVREVARLKLVSAQQLRQLHYRDSASARRLARLDLAYLTSQRVLGRLERRVGGVRAGSEGFVYGLDVVGQRLLHPGSARYRRPWTPQPQLLAHSLAISQLYVELRTAAEVWQLETFETEPAAWRQFSGPGGRRLILKPDAFVIGATQHYEDRCFIELDRATESLPRIRAQADSYVAYWQSGREQTEHGIFPKVLWIAPHEHRYQQLVEVLAQLPAETWQLFRVTTTERAVTVICDVPASHHTKGGER